MEIENTDGSGSEFDEGGEGSVTGVDGAVKGGFILRSLQHTNHIHLIRKINAYIAF